MDSPSAAGKMKYSKSAIWCIFIMVFLLAAILSYMKLANYDNPSIPDHASTPVAPHAPRDSESPPQTQIGRRNALSEGGFLTLVRSDQKNISCRPSRVKSSRGANPSIILRSGERIHIDCGELPVNSMSSNIPGNQFLADHAHFAFRVYDLTGKPVLTLPMVKDVFPTNPPNGRLAWYWGPDGKFVGYAEDYEKEDPGKPKYYDPPREDRFPVDMRFFVFDPVTRETTELEIPGRTPGWIARLDGVSAEGLLLFSEAKRQFYPDGMPLTPEDDAWNPLGAFRIPN